MGQSVVDAFLRGRLTAWAAFLVAVFVVAVAVTALRRERASAFRVLVMAAAVSVLSIAGLLAATALRFPRITWRRVDPPAFAQASGTSWRTLRAPSTAVLADGAPEVGLAGVEAGGRIRLFGLFSGAPLSGYTDAQNIPAMPGEPRICHVEAEECRAWPKDWPAPAPASSGSEFLWSREMSARALAYDVETGLMLHHVEGLRSSDGALAMAGSSMGSSAKFNERISDTWALQQLGKFSNEPSREGSTALFIVRRIANGRVDAARVVATPAGDGFTFSFERATVALGWAPTVYAWFSRPILLVLTLWFPLMSMAFQAAPVWWASRRRKRIAEGEPLSEMPLTEAEARTRSRLLVAQKLHGPTLLALGLCVAAPASLAVIAIIAGR
ncbi:MAG: hypothetical protein IPK82_11955 [Polyangiaceae bacterium]|nr:hypothetical protein [Polyangiaceae bacterium]